MKLEIQETEIGPIEYSISGSGFPIVILHGGHSNARDILSHKHIDKDRFTVVVPSRPGYGQTVVAQNKTPLDAARQIDQLMEILGYKQYHVIGISAGGPTALALSAHYKDRVGKLILASAVTKRWLRPGDKQYRVSKWLFNPLSEKYTWRLMQFFLRHYPGMIVRQMSSSLTTKRIRNIPPGIVNSMKEMLSVSASGRGFMLDLEHDISQEMLESIVADTVIIHSRNDKAVDATHPQFAAQWIKQVSLVWLDNDWGHMIWFDDTAWKEMNRFLQR